MSVFVKIKTSIIWAGILLSFACFGQINVPLGVLPMQYNSSFAGANGGPRISSSASYARYFSSQNNFFGLYTAYDQFIPSIRSGIGITAGFGGQNMRQWDIWPARNPRYHSLSLAVAPKFSIKGKYTISPSVDFTYNSARNLLHVSNIDSVTTITENSNHTLQSRAGLLFNTGKYYIGYSVNLIGKTSFSDTTPSFSWGLTKRYRSYLQMGYTFGRSSSKFSFTPQLVLQISDGWYARRLRMGLEAINLTFRYKQFIWGLNNHGVHVGWQTERIRLMATTGVSFITRNRDYNSFSGNISFRYLIPSKMQRKYTLPGTAY